MFFKFLFFVAWLVGVDGACQYFRGSHADSDSFGRKLQRKDDLKSSVDGASNADEYQHGWQRHSHMPSSLPSSAPLAGFFGECNLGPLCEQTPQSICSATQTVRTAFAAVTNDPITQSSILAIAVRLAFHDAGEFDQNAGDRLGPDGCLSIEERNSGLFESDSLVTTVMEPIWQSVCNQISRADFWVLFAKLALEKSDPTQTIDIPFQFGRRDTRQCQAGVGRLPEADFGLEEFQRVFVDQMGLTLADGVTLIGAHTLGHTHIPNEGYGQLVSDIDPSVPFDLVNAWDDGPGVFDNHYFQNLAGGPTWTHFASTELPETEWHIAPGSPFIMLNADMALSFSPVVNDANPPEGLGQQCGASALEGGPGCINPSAATLPSTASQVQAYIASNELFLKDFGLAFTRMTTVGYSVRGCNLSDGRGAREVTPGRSGTLQGIDLSQCPVM